MRRGSGACGVPELQLEGLRDVLLFAFPNDLEVVEGGGLIWRGARGLGAPSWQPAWGSVSEVRHLQTGSSQLMLLFVIRERRQV